MKIKNQGFRFILCFSILFTFGVVASFEALAAETQSISNFSITLSNISSDGGTSTAPGTNSPKTLTGKSISPGYAMIKLSDMKYLGATTSVSGNFYYVTINGQTLTFQKDSTNWSSSIAYTIAKPAGGSQSYTFSLNGTSECPAQLIDGIPYIRLTTAAHQAGALLANYDSASNTTFVYHFRVNVNTPHSDSNKYIVGGSWATSWSSKENIKLAPNFKVKEIWSESSKVPTTDTYHRQLKIAVQSLQSEENIRYHYNNNSSLTVTSGFRGFKHNINAEGEKRSLHMRGRAMDVVASDTVSLYNNIYNEFKGTSSTPISSGIYWLSRVWGTSASKSGAYDLEKMPRNNKWWIHLGVKPAFGDPS